MFIAIKFHASQTITEIPIARASRILATLLPALFLTLFATSAADGHPMGPMSINHTTDVEVRVDSVHLFYGLNWAEIPSRQLMERFDVDRNGALDGEERAVALEDLTTEVVAGLHTRYFDDAAQLDVAGRVLDVVPGEGGLPTLVLSLHLVAPLPGPGDEWRFHLDNRNYRDVLGWREIQVIRGAGVEILEKTILSSTGESGTVYGAPPDETTVTVRFRTGGGGEAQPRPQREERPELKSDTGLSQLIGGELSLSVILFGLLMAFGLGAVHALSPGHGKTLVAAYLVGSRGTIRHAAALGVIVTTSHVASVILLGVVTLFLSALVKPEVLYPWISMVAAVLVVVIGLVILVRRIRHPGGHTHGTPRSDSECEREGAGVSLVELLGLGISGGIVPCPSALVVLLAAITLNRLVFGLLLVIAFSAGLALVLTSIGVVMVKARALIAGRSWTGGIVRRLPIASAVIIVLIGLGLSWYTMIQNRWL